jgi:hypothetical protein
MTGPREELLCLIADLSEADPELRLGQMLTNLATLARGPEPESVWDCEDDELAVAARRLLTRIQERHSAIA